MDEIGRSSTALTRIEPSPRESMRRVAPQAHRDAPMSVTERTVAMGAVILRGLFIALSSTAGAIGTQKIALAATTNPLWVSLSRELGTATMKILLTNSLERIGPGIELPKSKRNRIYSSPEFRAKLVKSVLEAGLYLVASKVVGTAFNLIQEYASANAAQEAANSNLIALLRNNPEQLAATTSTAAAFDFAHLVVAGVWAVNVSGARYKYNHKKIMDQVKDAGKSAAFMLPGDRMKMSADAVVRLGFTAVVGTLWTAFVKLPGAVSADYSLASVPKAAGGGIARFLQTGLRDSLVWAGENALRNRRAKNIGADDLEMQALPAGQTTSPPAPLAFEGTNPAMGLTRPRAGTDASDDFSRYLRERERKRANSDKTEPFPDFYDKQSFATSEFPDAETAASEPLHTGPLRVRNDSVGSSLAEAVRNYEPLPRPIPGSFVFDENGSDPAGLNYLAFPSPAPSEADLQRHSGLSFNTMSQAVSQEASAIGLGSISVKDFEPTSMLAMDSASNAADNPAPASLSATAADTLSGSASVSLSDFGSRANSELTSNLNAESGLHSGPNLAMNMASKSALNALSASGSNPQAPADVESAFNADAKPVSKRPSTPPSNPVSDANSKAASDPSSGELTSFSLATHTNTEHDTAASVRPLAGTVISRDRRKFSATKEWVFSPKLPLTVRTAKPANEHGTIGQSSPVQTSDRKSKLRRMTPLVVNGKRIPPKP
ncbi:MAG: hypothetical protein ACRYGK_19440 [Janthinobacterium lividum]